MLLNIENTIYKRTKIICCNTYLFVMQRHKLIGGGESSDNRRSKSEFLNAHRT